jgi:hypothetical protein
MLSSAFFLAAIAIPRALEAYFAAPKESLDNDYVPDGR